MRIEVGYGLEGTLTDLHSKLIIENTMVPAFRAGDFAGGISAAVDDMIMVLEGNRGRAGGARQSQSGQRHSATSILSLVIFVLIWATIFFGGFAMAFLPPIFGTRSDRTVSMARHGPSDYGASSSRSGWVVGIAHPAAAGRRAVPAAAGRPARQRRRRLFGWRRLVRRRRGIGELVMTQHAHQPAGS